MSSEVPLNASQVVVHVRLFLVAAIAIFGYLIPELLIRLVMAGAHYVGH